MTPPDHDHDQDLIRRRQKSRALVLALLLGGLVVLIFFITLVRIRGSMQ
ncbi:hypothetical protein ACT009_09485 [Sphingomonas sp. Tas61C01]